MSSIPTSFRKQPFSLRNEHVSWLTSGGNEWLSDSTRLSTRSGPSCSAPRRTPGRCSSGCSPSECRCAVRLQQRNPLREVPVSFSGSFRCQLSRVNEDINTWCHQWSLCLFDQATIRCRRRAVDWKYAPLPEFTFASGIVWFPLLFHSFMMRPAGGEGGKGVQCQK